MAANMAANMRANMGANMGANIGANMGAYMGANIAANMGADMGANMAAKVPRYQQNLCSFSLSRENYLLFVKLLLVFRTLPICFNILKFNNFFEI